MFRVADMAPGNGILRIAGHRFASGFQTLAPPRLLYQARREIVPAGDQRAVELHGSAKAFFRVARLLLGQDSGAEIAPVRSPISIMGRCLSKSVLRIDEPVLFQGNDAKPVPNPGFAGSTT